MSLVGLATGLVVAAPAVAADHPVTFAAYAYSPSALDIGVNDTVTFSGSFMNHPLVWAEGDFAVTGTGATSSPFQFTHPGTYAYYCQLHGDSQNMRGVVRVPGDLHPARVSFATDPAAPQPGQAVTFTYTGDPDPDGSLVRWQWDLDGDGSLETTTSGPAAVHAYPTAGVVTVRVRAIDDGHEASATAEQAVTIAVAASGGAGAGGSGSGGSGSGASGSRDTTAPRATLVRLSGLKLSFRSSERATATATLRARGRTLARGSAKAGTTTIRLRLTAAGRATLRHGQRLRVTLTLTLRDTSANARKLTRPLTVRRP